MIELHAISYLDRNSALAPNEAGPQSSSSRPNYRKECRRNGVSLVVEGDEPVDAFIFDSPEFSLVCRADLLAERRVNVSPAAHIAELYQRKGDAFAVKLRGAFAVILYDHRTSILKAWTDHFGIERLVYSDSGKATAVSTDLRLLVSRLGQPPEIDPASIQQYLQYSCIPAPKTIYRGVAKLEPGHALACNPRPVSSAYWDMIYDEDNDADRTEVSWAGDTLKAIRSAVELNLKGANESELGCFLSGGTDSSSITGLVGQLTGQPPKSFSIGFDDPRYNEMQYARLAAERYNADHHAYFVKPADILSLIQKAVPAYDEPFGNSSIIPTYYCARLAAENGVTHLLAGDGGDELFGGNSRYVEDRVFQRYGTIPGFIRRNLIEPAVSVRALRNFELFDKAARYIRRAGIAPADRVFSYSFLSSVQESELFSLDFLSNYTGEHPLTPARTHFNAARAKNDLNRWMYLDLKIIITDNDVRKVSTMSRLAGVTTRYPLLEPTLARFSGTIPADLKVKGNQLRYLFKKATAELLPPEIISKSKHGFGLPYSIWVGEHKPLRDFTFDVLGSSRCRQRGYFRSDLLVWLWSQYETVHRTYYGDMLWVFLMLELWHSTQFDNRTAQQAELVPAMPQMNQC